MPLRGGRGGRRLMAKTILNFHFYYLHPSLRNSHICVVKQHTSYISLILWRQYFTNSHTCVVAIVCCYIVAKTAVRHHLHLQFVSITTFFDSNNRALAKLMIFYDFNILSGDAVLFCWQVERWHTICQAYSCLPRALKRLSFAEFLDALASLDFSCQ